jgi:drug/metabolite transporter (DMT)-like permease
MGPSVLFMSRSLTQRSGMLLALAASVGFALQAIWGMYAYKAGVNTATLLVMRFVIASVAFWAMVAVRRPERPPVKLIVAGLLLGLVPFAVESCSFFLALQHIDTGLAELLFYAYPVIVVASAILLRREPADRRRIGALVMASAGILLVLVGGAALHPDPTGIALALVAAVAYAGFVLGAHGILDRIDPFLLAALIFTGAGISLSGYGGAMGQIDVTGFGLDGWLQIALLASVSTLGAETAFLYALRHIGAGTASILSLLEPVVAAGLAWGLFSQALAPLQVAGGVLVLSAIVLLAPRRTTVSATHEPPAVAYRPAPTRTLALDPACGGELGVRAEVGRLSRPRVRRRSGHPPAVAQR